MSWKTQAGQVAGLDCPPKLRETLSEVGRLLGQLRPNIDLDGAWEPLPMAPD